MLTLCSSTLAVEMLSPIAVTETTEVGTGWGGGGEGVARPGRRLGGHASITFGYHRRPPRGPAPGFKGYAHAADPAPQERLVSKVAGWGSRESGMSQYKM